MKIDLSFKVKPCQCASYLLQCQGYPLLKKLEIRNHGDTLENLTLHIHSTSDALVPFEMVINQLEADTITVFDQVRQLQLNPNYLKTIFHKLTTEMVIRIYQNGHLLYSQAEQFDVMPLRSLNDPRPRQLYPDCFSPSTTMRADFSLETQVSIA